MDAKLRQYLLGAAVSIIMALGGCVAQNTFGRIDRLEAADNVRSLDNAVLKKEVEDFRQSFEEFKHDVKEDIKRHHR